MKFFKKYQIILTIVVVATLILEFVRYNNVDIKKTIEGYLTCGLMLFMIVLLFVVGICANKGKFEFKRRHQTIILVIGAILEIFILLVVCLVVEDKIKLREFKEIGYKKATAKVTHVERRTETSYDSDGDRRHKTVYYVTWSYDGYFKTEKGSERDIGDTETIYYRNDNPKITRWSLSESLVGANVCVVLVGIFRLANYYSTFIYKKKETEKSDDPIKEA